MACHCGHSEEDHGHDIKYPGSTACAECDCIAYERDRGDDDDKKDDDNDDDLADEALDLI